MQGVKWGGLLPISRFGSQHYSGVATGRALCARRARMRARQRQHARATWCWTHDRRALSRQEMVDFMSRHGPLCRDMSLWLQWAVMSRQESLCRDRIPR